MSLWGDEILGAFAVALMLLLLAIARVKPSPEDGPAPLLCMDCAEFNRRAFVRLIREVRGEYICEQCGRECKTKWLPLGGGAGQGKDLQP